jgi:photosystem II stability/assembly factor-like uncharacterized protein
MTKTYYVTRLAGQVRRLDDLTLPWVDVSTGHTDGFLDVMVVPQEIDNVIVVGRDRGIYHSIDAGATWTQAIGDYTTLPIDQDFIEVWIVDDQVSYIAGGEGGIVLKSIDGGTTYNSITYPTNSGTFDGDTTCSAIHFTDQNRGVAGVSGGGGSLVWQTVDGGNTWNVLNGGFTIGTSGCGGIHISADGQTIVLQTADGIYQSTDAGASFVQVYDLTTDFFSGSGRHLTWTDDSTLWVSGIYNTLRQSTDGGATWTTLRGPNPAEGVIEGAHFYDPLNGFLTQNQEIHTTSDAGTTTVISEANSAPLAIWSEVVEDQPVDPCYILTDCAGIADSIITGVDLSGNVDQVVTLADEDGNEIEGCWFVYENLEPCDSTEVVEVNIFRCYEDCDSCLPEPEPIRVAKPRVVLPNYTTGNCDPAIVEKAFCAFADLMHKEVMSKRFMIANCCPKDEALIWIRKEKIKLKLIESENPTPDPCNPVCSEYEMFIQPGYSAVTTYTDCNEKERTLNTPIASKIQQVTICSLDTNPPNVVVYDDQNEEFDRFVLLPVGECTP